MSDGSTTEGRRVTPRMVVGVVLLIAVGAFVVVNTDDVQIDFVFGDTSIPLILVLLAVLAVGGFVGYVLGRRHDRD